MQLHANAKTTPKMRDLIVRRVSSQDGTYREAAEAAGVSVRTVAKWVARFRGGGRPGFADGSSRPHRQPTATPVRTISAIVQLR
jgi:transposase